MQNKLHKLPAGKSPTVRRLIRKLPLMLALIITIFAAQYIYEDYRPSTVRAFGNLTVDLGVPSGQPIFTVTNMLPGDACETRTITVTNDSPSPSDVWVRSENETEDKNFSHALLFTITHDSETDYDALLSDFFAESHASGGIPLSVVAAGETETYVFQACLPYTTGNEYQQGRVQFDLVFAEILPDIELPPECSRLAGIITARIDGTHGNDDIRGTKLSELIIGGGGRDELDGGGGHDCIVGGAMKDELDGGDGNDIIIAGGGNDKIDGGDNDDIIYAEDGDDKVDGGHGQDTIYGGNGKDELDGRSGSDTIYGGAHDDELDGGSGDDKLYGESGNDKLNGGSGNDTLDGGSGDDKLKGGTGTDSCLGEQLSSCNP